MTELSEIQVAMCKVIKECGFEGLDKVKLQSFNETWILVNEFTPDEHLTWEIELDGRKLTQEEYEAWVKQND